MITKTTHQGTLTFCSQELHFTLNSGPKRILGVRLDAQGPEYLWLIYKSMFLLSYMSLWQCAKKMNFLAASLLDRKEKPATLVSAATRLTLVTERKL
jgi:hypothetical protein